jgi:hypothetical protein
MVATMIERPVPFTAYHFDLTEDKSMPRNLVLKYDWSVRIVMIYWHSGYRCDPFVNLFNSMPIQLTTLMSLVSAALQNRESSNKAQQPVQSKKIALESPSHSDDTHLWENDQTFGFFEVAYNPTNKKRENMIMNARFAHIFGFHKEELYARFANHEADMQRTMIDSLLLMMEGLQHVLDDSKSASVERYFRMFSGPARTPLLVWTMWGKGYNQLGQLIKASPSWGWRGGRGEFLSGGVKQHPGTISSLPTSLSKFHRCQGLRSHCLRWRFFQDCFPPIPP